MDNNFLLIKKYIITCDNKTCSCHEIYNDKKKIDEIIAKKQYLKCYKAYALERSKSKS
jgi:hypothetical protein